MFTLYEYPKCSTCRKAKAELTQLGLDFETVDIKETPPQPDQLKTWLNRSDLPLKAYFNTSGNSYRELGLKDRFDSLTVDEALSLLAQDGMLIKRPILVKDDQVLQIGYRSAYKNLNLS